MELFKNVHKKVRKSHKVRIFVLKTYQCVIVENYLFLEFLFLINPKLAVDSNLGSVLCRSDLVLLDVLLAIFSNAFLTFNSFLLTLSVILFIFVFLIVLDITLLLSVVVTDRALLTMI